MMTGAAQFYRSISGRSFGLQVVVRVSAVRRGSQDGPALAHAFQSFPSPAYCRTAVLVHPSPSITFSPLKHAERVPEGDQK